MNRTASIQRPPDRTLTATRSWLDRQTAVHADMGFGEQIQWLIGEDRYEQCEVEQYPDGSIIIRVWDEVDSE